MFKKSYDGAHKYNYFVWRSNQQKITKKIGLIAAFSFLFAAPVHAVQVTVSAAIPTRGDETTGFEQRTYGGHFPYFGAQTAVLPAGYLPKVLSNSAPAYFLVSGLYDVSKPTLDIFSLMQLSSLPGTAALEEVNKLQTELLHRNTTVFSEVLVLNQYDNLVTRSLLKADIVADLATNDKDSNTSERYIAQFVEAASGATYFELTYGSHVVATINASNSAPTLAATPFAETSLRTDSVTRWNTFDADNNTLTFSIYYRKDPNTPLASH